MEEGDASVDVPHRRLQEVRRYRPLSPARGGSSWESREILVRSAEEKPKSESAAGAFTDLQRPMVPFEPSGPRLL